MSSCALVTTSGHRCASIRGAGALPYRRPQPTPVVSSARRSAQVLFCSLAAFVLCARSSTSLRRSAGSWRRGRPCSVTRSTLRAGAAQALTKGRPGTASRAAADHRTSGACVRETEPDRTRQRITFVRKRALSPAWPLGSILSPRLCRAGRACASLDRLASAPTSSPHLPRG